MPPKHGAGLVTIHRLGWGGAMQYVPASRLGGETEEGSSSGAGGSLVPTCPRLDAEVRALHGLARRGLITAESAERQINTYLLAPHAPPGRIIPARWLLLPLADAPHPGLMPDLGQVVHRVLARDPLPCSLSRLVEQCIPRFRHAARTLEFPDSQPVLLTLAMGLLLGLYPGAGVKRPGFAVRSAVFARLHALLTSPGDRQTEFCQAHEPVLLLACMEYLARVLPAHMPVHDGALSGGDAATQAFYRRIPPLCDELRQCLDTEEDGSGCWGWARIRAECAARVERVARLKRCHPPTPDHHHHPANAGSPAAGFCAAAWEAPALPDGSPDEFRLLGLALGVPGGALQQVQQEVRITPLPGNLRRIQLERLTATGPAGARTAYLQSRRYICARCMASPRGLPAGAARLRLDTLTQRLVCATCLAPDPVCVSLLGRSMLLHRTHYYLCPACTTVQAYRGDAEEQPWVDGGTCGHQPRPAASHAQRKRRDLCGVCSEPALANATRRVDQLTGEMHEFHYCQRHAPRPEAARLCVNARQMGALGGRPSPLSSMK